MLLATSGGRQACRDFCCCGFVGVVGSASCDAELATPDGQLCPRSSTAAPLHAAAATNAPILAASDAVVKSYSKNLH